MQGREGQEDRRKTGERRRESVEDPRQIAARREIGFGLNRGAASIDATQPRFWNYLKGCCADFGVGLGTEFAAL